jgi:hypothetical protein
MFEFLKSIDTEIILALIVMIQGYMYSNLVKRVKALEDEKVH